ncbi:hypothetical protein B0H13DRAFT_1983049 [Mycena leptocephala]|nr:hypothetical protein B0H13DRAFT_1983049 [Mycena leptocephala]
MPQAHHRPGYSKMWAAKAPEFLDIPLDCMIEIFSYLQPAELLHLARLCIYLRSFALDKSSRHIWRRAFRNLDRGPLTDGPGNNLPSRDTALFITELPPYPPLPPCPPDLTEPQYANLIFSQHCHGCLEVYYGPVDWDLRVRYCNQCESANTRSFCKEDPARLECDPSADIQKLVAIRPPTFRPAFLATDFAAVENVYKRMDTCERRRYEIECNEILVHRRIHARECRAWSAALKSGRVKAIRTRLLQLDWRDELYSIDIEELAEHPWVNRYELLDESAWTKMKPELEDFMASIRAHLKADRAERDRKRILRDKFWLTELGLGPLHSAPPTAHES